MMASKSARTTILIVDDYADFLDCVAALLSDHVIHKAATAQEALRLARIRPYHLYVVDCHLPDVSGLSVCRAIRAFDPHTPVLMLSGDPLQREALAAGATAFLLKSGDPRQLIRFVAELIARQQIRNETACAVEQAVIAEARREQAAREAAAHTVLRTTLAEIGAQVKKTRRILDDVRALRALAFQHYVQRGGGRAGFVEQWPQVEASELD